MTCGRLDEMKERYANEFEENDLARLAKAIANINFKHELIDLHSLEKLCDGAGEVNVYKFVLNKKAFVARITPNNRSDLLNNALVASKIGYGPKIYYSDIDERGSTCCIMDFLHNENTALLTGTRYLSSLIYSMQKMHQGDCFNNSKPLFQFLLEMNDWLNEQNIPFPTNDIHEIVIYHQNVKLLESLWPMFKDDIRPVHHDLNPTNIIYDGTSLTIIDYDTAAQDALYVDLCITANFYCTDDKARNKLLALYFKKSLDEEKIHKFNYIRPFAFILHALWLASSAGIRMIPDQKITQKYPTYSALQLLLVTRKFDISIQENVFILSAQMFKEGISLMLAEDFKKAERFLKKKIT
jgi:hypothetical protein